MSGKQREHLGRLGALAINAAGQEILHGLTVEDSRFVLRCSEKSPAARSEHERERYARLLARHERARLQGVSVADPVVKNEANLG